jgi:general stress protein YciG
MPDMIDDKPRAKQRRGFAVMDPDKRREIAKKGGHSVKPVNRSFSKDRKLAMNAGRKGGLSSRGGGRKTVERARVDYNAVQLIQKYTVEE